MVSLASLNKVDLFRLCSVVSTVLLEVVHVLVLVLTNTL